jgi:hypothetical protein
MVHEDLAHDARGNREELGAVLPVHPPEVHEAHVGLMDEGRRCQGVVSPLRAQPPAGDPPQVLVDSGYEPTVRGPIAMAPPHE